MFECEEVAGVDKGENISKHIINGPVQGKIRGKQVKCINIQSCTQLLKWEIRLLRRVEATNKRYNT